MNESISGSIGIMYRRNNGELEFLGVENAKTKNITFVSGAKEDNDFSEVDVLKREIHEELGLNTDKIEFYPTEFHHDFIFGEQKKERAGMHASYTIFLVDVTNIRETITHTKELRSIQWLSKDQVIEALSFPDLVELFLKATEKLSK